VWSERRYRSQGTDYKEYKDNKDTSMCQQEAQGRTAHNTYPEQARHVRYRAHVPISDGLIEFVGILRYGEGQMSARSEHRRTWGTDGEETIAQQHTRYDCTYTEHVSHVRH